LVQKAAALQALVQCLQDEVKEAFQESSLLKVDCRELRKTNQELSTISKEKRNGLEKLDSQVEGLEATNSKLEDELNIYKNLLDINSVNLHELRNTCKKEKRERISISKCIDKVIAQLRKRSCNKNLMKKVQKIKKVFQKIKKKRDEARKAQRRCISLYD